MKTKYLYLEPPKKAMSVADWKEMGFEDGPPGAYVPNVAEKDLDKFRAKLFYKKTEDVRIEIRTSRHGSQILVVVRPKPFLEKPKYEGARPVKAEQVKLTCNGPLQMSFAEWNDFNEAIKEAKELLTIMKK
jgi:hypothetical protein